MTKHMKQHRHSGFCSRCRKNIRFGKPLLVIQGRPYCPTCGETREGEIGARR